MIEAEAVFTKEEIPKVANLKGALNKQCINLFGGHTSGTLRFKRFRGRHIGDHVFRGTVEFEEVPEGEWDPDIAKDFDLLIAGIEEA